MGRPAKWPTIESCCRISIRDFSESLREGLEWSSQFTWGSGFTVNAHCRIIVPDYRQVRLRYTAGGEYTDETAEIDETIGLERVPQRISGFRWFFICPSANRRCTTLYQPPGAWRFRSREGFRYRLQYQSQRLAPMSRYQHGAVRAAKRVLKKGPREWQEEYEDWDFPPKPKWMRWKTYNRLDEKALAYEKAADDALLWRLRRLLIPGEDVSDLMDRILK